MSQRTRQFVLGIVLSGFALLLALHGAREIDQSHFVSGATFDILALLLSCYVIVKLVPRNCRPIQEVEAGLE